MQAWPVQDAKVKFREFLDACLSEGSQMVTKRGAGAAVFRRWARLMHGTSNTLYEDAMIAATADVHGLTVVTRKVADFKSFGLALLNPFTKAHG